MLVFPNAKINLGLNILRKRPDGYHDIESCLYPIPWYDALKAVPSEQFSFKQTGLTIDGKQEDNLCIKAFHIIRNKYNIPSVSVHLHKVIPMGAGLGGGSADGAFMLKLLNSLFELRLSSGELEEYAASLGSDCPFFIKNVPSIASGTGTTLQVLDLDLSEYYVGLIYPSVHVSTKEAYSGVVPNSEATSLSNKLLEGINTWSGEVKNDFQPSIASNHIQIQNALDKINLDGPLYSAMSGSGAAVFGLFDKKPESNGYNLLEKLQLRD